MQAINAGNFSQNFVQNVNEKPQFIVPQKNIEPKNKSEIIADSKPIINQVPEKIGPNPENKAEEKTEIISENIEPKVEKIQATTKTADFSFRRLLTELKDEDPVVLATIKNASFKQDGDTLELSF